MRLACFLALFATGAVARDCPTSADLVDGIIARDTVLGEMYMFQQVDGQVARSLFTRATGPNPVTPPIETVDMSILLPLDVSTFDHPLFISIARPTDRSRYTYQTPVRSLATFFEDGEWENRISMLAGYTVRLRGTHKITVLEETTYDLGDCSYVAYRIEDTISLDGEETRQFERWYAPDLGLVVAQDGMLVTDQEKQSAYRFDEVYKLVDLMAE